MARKKKTKRVPKGSHRMPDGTIMKDKAMKRKRGRKVKKAPALNRQEPWFLGRDYSSTSFTQLHQVNKYNHAVEGLEVLRGYTGRQNELDRRINEQKGSQDDLYKRVDVAQKLAEGIRNDYKKEMAAEQADRRSGLAAVHRDLRADLVQSLQDQQQNLVGVIQQDRQHTLKIINQRSADNRAFFMARYGQSKPYTPGTSVGYSSSSPRSTPSPIAAKAATPSTQLGSGTLLGQVSPTTQYRPASPRPAPRRSPSPTPRPARRVRSVSPSGGLAPGVYKALRLAGLPDRSVQTSAFDRRVAEIEAARASNSGERTKVEKGTASFTFTD